MGDGNGLVLGKLERDSAGECVRGAVVRHLDNGAFDSPHHDAEAALHAVRHAHYSGFLNHVFWLLGHVGRAVEKYERIRQAFSFSQLCDGKRVAGDQ